MLLHHDSKAQPTHYKPWPPRQHLQCFRNTAAVQLTCEAAHAIQVMVVQIDHHEAVLTLL